MKRLAWLAGGVVLASWMLLTIALSGFVSAGCAHQAESHPAVSMRDIAGLGTNPSLDDVTKLVGGLPLMEIPYIEYPAKEGGIFVFLFIPTNEVSEPAVVVPGTMALVAVLRVESHDAFMRGEGRYVFPKSASDKRFTGFSLGPTADPDGHK